MHDKNKKSNAEIVFFTEADYHIRNAAYVVRILKTFKLNCIIFESCAAERKMSDHEKRQYCDINIIHVSTFDDIFLYINPSVVKIAVSYSSGSAKTRDVLQRLSYDGIKTASVVEGVWDFLGLILGINQLTPYRNCDYTFLSGYADTLYFEDRMERCYIGGLASVRDLLSKKVTFPDKPLAVINVNFSYGQAEFGRNIFIETAVKGCEEAGIEYIITQHPHDFSAINKKYPVSKKSMYQLIEEGSIFISRFANGIIEALAMGKPVIYHNPHKEAAINFQDPMGAYLKSHDAGTLVEAINYQIDAIKKRENFREKARKFLQYHANIFSRRSPEENITSGILDILKKDFAVTNINVPNYLIDNGKTDTADAIEHSQILLNLFQKHKSKRKYPKVSIIVPVYNIKPFLLRKCLDSAINQTLLSHEYEIIIVNDASTDNSLDIIREYEQKYNNIHVVNKPQNEGLGMARNSGMDIAKGEYVFFLDGDDFISVMTIDRLYIEAKLNDAELVSCSHIKVNIDNGYKILGRRTDLEKVPHDKLSRVKAYIMHKHYSVNCGVLIKRSLFVDHNISFPKGYHEDIVVWLKLITYAKSFLVLNEPFYNYVQHGISITGSISKDRIHDYLQTQKDKWIFINNYYGKETASRHFERYQIFQYGVLHVVNVLVRDIFLQEPNFMVRKELYKYLYDSVNSIHFMVNSPVFYNQISPAYIETLWNIMDNNSYMTDDLLRKYEVIINLVTDQIAKVGLNKENNIAISLPTKGSRVYYHIKKEVTANLKIAAQFNLISPSHINGLIIRLARHDSNTSTVRFTYEGSKIKVQGNTKAISISHKFIKHHESYRLWFENVDNENLHFVITPPIFTEYDSNKNISTTQDTESINLKERLADSKIRKKDKILKIINFRNKPDDKTNTALCRDPSPKVRDSDISPNNIFADSEFLNRRDHLPIRGKHINGVQCNDWKYAKPIIRNSPLFLVGNGPSLCNIEFKKLQKVQWIGMNAAYRFWEKSKIYPDHYICLDTVVLKSHMGKINELILNRKSNGIKTFFLRKNILSFFPALKDIPEVLFLDDYYKSPYFDGLIEHLTTGSFSALFAAMLGYKLIYLLGIDLHYIQILPEAKMVHGHVLEIKETPDRNPNYFFNDYQRKGDLYNVPDSSMPNLHYNSWIKVKSRLESFNVTVLNCNAKSEVDIFGYADPNDVLK